MNEVLPHEAAHQRARDWRKSASDHVAYALLVYTALQIFVTVQAMKRATTESLSIMPYLALIILVAAIIPACRKFERRWALRPDDEAHDPALAGDFRRDITMLWALAILLPLALTAFFMVIAAVL